MKQIAFRDAVQLDQQKKSQLDNQQSYQKYHPFELSSEASLSYLSNSQNLLNIAFIGSDLQSKSNHSQESSSFQLKLEQTSFHSQSFNQPISYEQSNNQEFKGILKTRRIKYINKCPRQLKSSDISINSGQLMDEETNNKSSLFPKRLGTPFLKEEVDQDKQLGYNMSRQFYRRYQTIRMLPMPTNNSKSEQENLSDEAFIAELLQQLERNSKSSTHQKDLSRMLSKL